VNRRILIIGSDSNVIVYNRISFSLSAIKDSGEECAVMGKDMKRFVIKDVISLTRVQTERNVRISRRESYSNINVKLGLFIKSF
jgi:hypothetical protein